MNRKGVWLVILAAMAALASCATRQQFDGEEDFRWEVSDNGVIIVGYLGANADVRIPQRIQRMPVTGIGARAFHEGHWEGEIFVAGENNLATVAIPDNVLFIEEAAFAYNQLVSVAFGSRVISIGDWAFHGNHLSSVAIPDRVTHIGYFAFWNNRLSSVAFGASVTSIGAFAFWSNRLTSVIIPDSVTYIGYGAFSNNQLASITIGNNVAIDGDGGFGAQFIQLYESQGRMAGTYTYSDGEWVFQAR